MEISEVIKDCEGIISFLKIESDLKISDNALVYTMQKDILYYETLIDWLVELKQRREADKWREDYLTERADEV